MAVYGYVNISLPEAKQLADLYGIAHDLEACRNYCEIYLEERTKLGQATGACKHLECFSTYVFVKYGRCFKGGVRDETARKLTADLSPDDERLHHLVLDIRDKYVAHSVSDLETHKVRVWLNPEERGRKINDVNIESQYLWGHETRLFEELKRLVEKLLTKVKATKKEEAKKLTELVGSKIDLDELYSGSAEVPEFADYSKVSRPRKFP